MVLLTNVANVNDPLVTKKKSFMKLAPKFFGVHLRTKDPAASIGSGSQS